ncbi:MAG: tetratricopeptide repeat protein [Bacteroidales bacterium]|nr:tetratricopeptide repeat protein [Bacteroidales bacterium]
MRKIIFLLNLVLIIFAGCSPRAKVTSSQTLKDSGKLEQAFNTINEAIDPGNENADKVLNWPRTWEIRGEIFQAIFQSEDEKIQKLSDEPLTEAFNSYKKALELDDKGRSNNSLKVKLTLLTNDLTNQAVKAFNDANYAKALTSFEQILDIQSLDIVKEDNPNAIDTVILYHAELAAYNSENYAKAINYYRESAKYEYGGAKTYGLIATAYQMNKDTVGALGALQEGFEKYPNDNVILTSMIQLYLDLKKTEDAMKYLDMAIKQDPDNATFHFAQGTLYEKIDQMDNAVTSYTKAINSDKEFFNAYYNLGALYYNEGVKQIDVANTIPTSDNTRYQAELAKADEWFKKSLPYMEKCHELDATDKMTMESLKNLYYRLKDMDNYNKMLEKLDQ